MNLFKRVYDVIKSTNSKIKGHPYASRHWLYSWFQYIRLYSIARVFNSKLKYKWVNEISLYVDVRDWAFARNCYLRLNEFVDSCFAVHYLKEGNLFIDAGANVGHYSLLAGKIAKAKVISFEPHIDTYLKLKRNISMNRLDNNTKIYNLGLGDKTEEVILKSMRNNGHNYILNSKDGDRKVKIISLSDLEYSISPSLIKIDVEGYEKKVLTGAKNILKDKNLNAMIIEISHHCERYGHTIKDTYDFICRLGFKSYKYDPFSRELTYCDLKNYLSDNIIFIRDLKEAQTRVKSGKSIQFDKNYFI